MTDWIEILQSEWAIRALIASVLVGLICGLLGCFIVLRNMALIGDALSHAILPGVVFAYVLVGSYSVLAFFVGSTIAGLIAAVAITWIQQHSTTKDDAAIGIVFTALFSIGVMGISWISRNQGVHLDLKDFLFGNVLGVANEDLWLTGIISIYVVVSIILFYRYLFISTFQPVIAETMGISVKVIHYFLMLLLSFAVVASLRTVGVILVVAMLITPAATALLLSNRLKQVLFLASIFGILAAILGLFFSIVFNTTPGPAMAVVATIFYLLALLFSPEKGLLFRFIRRQRLNDKILLEDALKQAFRLSEKQALSFSNLQSQLNLKKVKINNLINQLKKKGFLENTTALALTRNGRQAAQKLVRAHRLWETYQVDKMGLQAGQIHDEAEHYEHFLTDEMIDLVDAELGYPTTDPHGSPIPGKFGFPPNPLSRLALNEAGYIDSNQNQEDVSAKLWELGIPKNSLVKLIQKTPNDIEILLEKEKFSIPRALANRINIISKYHSNNKFPF